MSKKRYVGKILLHAPIGGRTHGQVLEYGLAEAKDEAYCFAVLDGYRPSRLRWSRADRANPAAWHLVYDDHIVGAVREVLG